MKHERQHTHTEPRNAYKHEQLLPCPTYHVNTPLSIKYFLVARTGVTIEPVPPKIVTTNKPADGLARHINPRRLLHAIHGEVRIQMMLDHHQRLVRRGPFQIGPNWAYHLITVGTAIAQLVACWRTWRHQYTGNKLKLDFRAINMSCLQLYPYILFWRE